MLNLSPALYEAKINLEDFRAANFVYLVDEDGKYAVLADPEADSEEVGAKFDTLFDDYIALVKVAAHENSSSEYEVMRYMDEAYAEAFPNNETYKAYMAK